MRGYGFFVIVFLLLCFNNSEAQNYPEYNYPGYNPNPNIPNYSNNNNTVTQPAYNFLQNDPYFSDYLKLTKKSKENKKIISLYNRKLIVVLAEEDPDKIKYYKSSPKKISFYKELIKTNNELITQVAQNYWQQLYPRAKEADTILFRTYSECLALSKTDIEDYFTIEFSSLRQNENAALFQLGGKEGNIDYRKALLNRPNEFGRFEVKLIEDFTKPFLHDFLTITSYPNELDFIIAIQQINNFFLERFKYINQYERYKDDMTSRREKLSNKILLIDSAQAEKTSGAYSFIHKEFPYKHQLTDYKGVLEAIKRKDTAYAYIVVLPYISLLGDNTFENTSNNNVIDSKSGTPFYSHLMVNAANAGVYNLIRNESRIINKKSWQRYAINFEFEKLNLK